MANESGKFACFLRSKGMKFTPERKFIIKEVFSNHNHFEAEDIVLSLRNNGLKVSRASVYRTLPLLVESGLLREVLYGERHDHYEHIFGHKHHDHLICTACGRTIEFYNPDIEQLQEKICAKYGFKTTDHIMQITGLCRECASKEGSNDTR